MVIKEMQATVFKWTEKMGWHNKTYLEYLALIGSEVGECVNECRGVIPTEHLGEELADIIIRVFDFASVCGIDLEQCISDKMILNLARTGNKNGRIK